MSSDSGLGFPADELLLGILVAVAGVSIGNTLGTYVSMAGVVIGLLSYLAALTTSRISGSETGQSSR